MAEVQRFHSPPPPGGGAGRPRARVPPWACAQRPSRLQGIGVAAWALQCGPGAFRGAAQHAGFAARGSPGETHHPQGGGVTASPAARRNLSAPFLVYRASRCRHRWRGANEHRRHIGDNSGGPGRRSRCRRGGSIRRTRAALKDLHSGLYRRPTLAPRARRRPRQCASRGFSCVVLQSRPQPDSALERRGHACAVVLIKGRSPDQDRPSRIPVQWIAVMVRGGEARARTAVARGVESGV